MNLSHLILVLSGVIRFIRGLVPETRKLKLTEAHLVFVFTVGGDT